MTTSSKVIQDALNERRTKFPNEAYDASWAAVKRQRPELFAPKNSGGAAGTSRSVTVAVNINKPRRATKNFVEAVNELQRREGLSWDLAWSETKRRRPDLSEAMNELPPGSQLTADAQRLVPDWPVPPAILGALGLPMAASREQYLIFRTAEKVKTITPEMAAKILVTIVQFNQLTQGATFDQTWEALRKHKPEIFAQLQEVGANELARGSAAGSAHLEAANEALAIGPVCCSGGYRSGQ